MNQVTILGANSLIGQHIIFALQSNQNIKLIKLWEDEKFIYRLNDNFNEISECEFDYSKIRLFIGLDLIEDAICNSDIIFNLYEAQDFSLIPNKKILYEKNVFFVNLIMEKCKITNVKRLIHLSSIYLQCSARWPNVDCREELDYKKFCNEVPFPDYCNSKHEAEKIILKNGNKIQNVCARVGAVFGEGDIKSIVCDAIFLSQYYQTLPRIGDKDGTIQITYVGNVAFALLKCAEKLFENNQITNEIVLIHDETPALNFYDIILEPLSSNKYFKSNDYNDNEVIFLNKKTNYLCISKNFISFYIFFPIYYLFCIIAWLWTKLINKNSLIAKIPSPNFLYILFHHWTFYSDFKLRIFFNFKPKFNYNESLHRSINYYRQLDINNIENFSWY